jgi:recombination protein RecR
MRYPDHLSKLIQILKQLPGVGNKSAERFAFHLLNWSAAHLQEFGNIVQKIPCNIKECPLCGSLMGEEGCLFCNQPSRDKNLLCVIASPREVFAIEETREFRGLYHVLGGVLSPFDARGPEHLTLDKLKQRLDLGEIKEIVLAFDSTLEGDATALFLKQELLPYSLYISRIAFGIPIGSSLDYVDGGTLARAFLGRSHF